VPFSALSEVLTARCDARTAESGRRDIYGYT